jgi:hypothetical protein
MFPTAAGDFYDNAWFQNAEIHVYMKTLKNSTNAMIAIAWP